MGAIPCVAFPVSAPSLIFKLQLKYMQSIFKYTKVIFPGKVRATENLLDISEPVFNSF